MENVVNLKRTANSSATKQSGRTVGNARSLSFLGGEALVYATNLIRDWEAQLLHLDGLKKKSVESHSSNLFRLLNHAQVAPWELKPVHVSRFFESRMSKDGQQLAPSTVAVYCAGWRSFQAYMLDMERVNEIQATFKVRPVKFVTEENGIAVKRHKLNAARPKAWALTPTEIDAIDQQFAFDIKAAYASRSKSLLPLQRDRVMFHIAIHFALRVSELVTIQLHDFKASYDPRMKAFQNFGTLTITGKNDSTGTIPMREPEIYELLMWYLSSIRQKILLRRKNSGNGLCRYDDKVYATVNLLFPSERGGVINPNAFRTRLNSMAVKAGLMHHKLTPHILRHTGCTNMVGVCSAEVAQKYMRHKNLYTTLGYYHPAPLDAANEANAPLNLFSSFFDDED